MTDHGGAVEIRAFQGDGKTISELFPPGTDPRKIAVRALALDKKCKGVYLTINPIRPDLEGSAKDKDVLSRALLLVDIDPKRPSDTNATDNEKRAARIVADAIRADLRRRGWPEPIVGDSGNGYHILYHVNLPNDAAAKKLVSAVLKALAKRFNTAEAEVDTKVGNASRISKVYGTTPRKGEPTDERPHRPAVVLKAPERLEPVPVALIEELIAEGIGPKPEPKPPAPRPRRAERNGSADPVADYAQEALRREAGEVASASEGRRNDTLNRSAFNLGTLVGAGVLDRAEAEAELTAAAEAVGLGDAEIQTTIRSGLDAGEREPRDLSHVGSRRPSSNGRPHRMLSPNGNGHVAVIGDGLPDVLGPNEDEDDPHRLARLYRDEQCSHPDGWTLRYWCDEMWRWDGAAWRPAYEKEIRAELAGVIKREFDRLNVQALRAATQEDVLGTKKPPRARKVTASLVCNTTLALTSYLLLPSNTKQPGWISEGAPWLAKEILPTKNALVHLPSLVAGLPCTLDPTPNLFNPYALDYSFDESAPAPSEWLKFLGQLWPDDPESVDTLGEWFGYCLTADTKQQKILAVLGPRRSGKGTVARVLKAMIGASNVAGPSLTGLAGNFGLSPLIGKPVAIISDARLSGRTDQAVIVERLLSISGEDTLTIDRKHVSAWTGQLPTRIVLISNELPRLSDSSGALSGRLVLLRLTESFYGREDKDLTDRLMGELPGILMWSIAGWDRLRRRGHFLQPAAGKQMVEEMEDLASPISAFIRERCEIRPGREEPTKDVYKAWRAWCEAAGRKEPGDEQNFGRNLRAAIPHISTRQTRLGGSAVRLYVGIGLLSAVP